MPKSFAIGTGILSLFLAGAASAQFVSLNFTEFASDLQQVDSDETYGVSSLGSVVGGWNNFNKVINATDLAFSTGAASTVDMSGTASGGYGSAGAGYNDTPMKGFLASFATPVTMTLSDLNASFVNGYFAIVYLTGFNLNNGASISDGTSTYYFQALDHSSTTWSGLLTQTTTTSDLGDGNAPVAQYAVFGSQESPLTADSLSLTFTNLYGGGSGIGGVQLVAVPEPGIMALVAGLASLVLIAVRRRRS